MNGKKYKKSEIIAQLKALGKQIRVNASDEVVLKAVNSLNDEDESTLFAALTPVSPATT